LRILNILAALLTALAFTVVLRSLVALAQSPSCTAAIVARESQGNYSAINPSSGSFGAYQLMPHGGVYDEYAHAHGTDSYATPVTTLTPAQQDEVFSWAVANYGFAPWGGC
jgi:hypothetical protein